MEQNLLTCNNLKIVYYRLHLQSKEQLSEEITIDSIGYKIKIFVESHLTQLSITPISFL